MMNKILVTRALANRVLVVAVVGEDFREWAAFVDAVPGKDHEQERDEVARTGNKLPYEIAKLIFPALAIKYQWRD